MLPIVELLGVGLIVLMLVAARRAVKPADVKSLIGETFLVAAGSARADTQR
jgi:hypothetical protein